MDDALKSNLVTATFAGNRIFTREELRLLYQENGERTLNENTLLSRIYGLKKKGIISSIERGRFILGGRPDSEELLTGKEFDEIYGLLSAELPHVKFTIWPLDTLVALSGSEVPPKQNLVFLETDKEACESVFEEIRQHRKDIFLKPDAEILLRYASMYKHPLVIKPLISEAPLDKIKDQYCPSLEKLCVDIMAEPVYFSELKGQPYRNLVKRFFGQNVINHSALRRYASRRGCLNQIRHMLHTLNLNLM